MKANSAARAFTLVEVVVTSTISVIMMTAVLGLLTNLDVAERAAQVRLTRRHDTSLLREILAQDFSCASTVLVGAGEFHLAGAIGRDRGGRSNLQVGQAHYFIRSYRGVPWLVREQITEGESREDLLWCGASSIAVGPSTSQSPALVRVRIAAADESMILDSTISIRPGGLE